MYGGVQEMPSRVVNGEWQTRSSMGDISFSLLDQAGSALQLSAVDSRAQLLVYFVVGAAVLVLAETLKKLLLFIPKTLLRRLFRPTRALGDLGGPWGREI